MSLVAGFFSIFTMATISTVPIEDANALNCSQVDASSYGRCDIDRDISEEGFRDCVNNVNCFATQTVNVQNTLRSSEEAKIHLDLEQYLNCGNPDCLNVDNQQEAFNIANQRVAVTSAGSSVVDFDVDAHMNQRSDGEGQEVYIQDNTGTQEFLINAANSANVDADGDGNDVEFRMDQFNDECDNSDCSNSASQQYEVLAQGTSRVDISSDTGFTVNQLNNGCDNFDNQGLTDEVRCFNSSTQELNILTPNPSSTTTNRATVIYDTLGPSTTEQTTDCEFGDINCANTAESFVNIGAIGTSRVDMDDIEQDVSQYIDCDNGVGMDCQNQAFLNVAVQAESDGIINVNQGSQTATQSSSCDDDADCIQIADLFVGLGVDAGGINAVTGTLNTNYNQEVTQIADCEDASCTNNAIMN
ncbi:MAG TPA: hypothetical protein VLA48_08715, partial [Nitrososphaeraceae archaeon]|nr:hypothetical protein [Nitrososphaeraceae archaeon]